MKWQYKSLLFLILLLFCVGSVCATDIIKNNYHFNDDGSFTGVVVKITNNTNNNSYEYTEVTIYRDCYESCNDWNGRVTLLKNDVENNKLLRIGDYL